MSRPTESWKAVERAIARFWPGARRRGADFRGEGHAGKTDLIIDGWAIEIKTSKRPTFSLMAGAVTQAEANKTKPDDIPLAVIHKAGTRYKDSLVVMRLETFQDFFINKPTGDR